MAELPGHATVYNHDIIGVYNRLNRFIVELIHSVSANVSQVNQFDMERLKSYLNNVKKYLGWVMAQPLLDLPETTPRVWVLEAPTTIPDMDNEEVADIVRMLELARDELTHSQSARQGSGLIPFDALRFNAVIAKTETFLSTYVEVVTPIDLPESSPDEAMILGGRRGI